MNGTCITLDAIKNVGRLLISFSFKEADASSGSYPRKGCPKRF